MKEKHDKYQFTRVTLHKVKSETAKILCNYFTLGNNSPDEAQRAIIELVGLTLHTVAIAEDLMPTLKNTGYMKLLV